MAASTVKRRPGAAGAGAGEPLRVVVAEDQALLREGLVLLLERHGFEVAGTAADGAAAVRKARAHRPDALLADIRMPPTQTDEGLRAALAARAEVPELAVVVLSQHLQPRYAQELLELAEDGGGGVGYLLKQRIVDGESFCGDLRRVCRGASVLDREVVAAVLGRLRRDDPVQALTPRRREVLALMAEGWSNAAIASRLNLTEKAVLKHVAQVYRQLGLGEDPSEHRRVRAVIRFLES